MPKLEQGENQAKDGMLRALIKKNMSLNNYTSMEQLANQIGVSRFTLYTKMKSPENFTVRELRAIFKALRFLDEDKKII